MFCNPKLKELAQAFNVLSWANGELLLAHLFSYIR
jgi:hypothetical protein